MIDIRRLLQRFIRLHTRPVTGVRQLADPLPPALLPATHQAAAQSLVEMVVVQGIPYKNRTLRESRVGVAPDMLRFSLAFQKELQRRGMPFFVHDYVRTKEEQNALHKRGISKAKWGQSPHNFGMAADIVHFGKYWDLTKLQWDVIGLIGKEVARRCNIKVTWGGDWNFYDPAHWELADWKKRAIARDV